MPIRDKRYHRLWKRKRNLTSRLEAIAIFGGKCKRCGNSDPRVLEFDHRIAVLRTREQRWVSTSQDTVSKILRGIFTKKDVDLVCANCHRLKTYTKDKIRFKNYLD